MIKELRLQYPVPDICVTLDVSVSGYYRWLGRGPSKRDNDDMRLEIEVLAAHKRMRKTYGSVRLQEELADHGIDASLYRIRRIRKKLGLRCKQKKKFKATTNSRHSLPVAENILDQNFDVTAPNQVWVTDITYIPTEEGWLYLAGHKDIYTGELVGYAMDSRMTKDLVVRSLLQAVPKKRPGSGLIHHSDRGSQYCSYEYRSLLNRLGMVASMSRKGNCYDNAPMESFWGTLKSELIHHTHYRDREEAKKDITEYIEIFYNRQRKQERLGYLSPAAFERQYYERILAAA